jgi:hypothetical protein
MGFVFLSFFLSFFLINALHTYRAVGSQAMHDMQSIDRSIDATIIDAMHDYAWHGMV